MREAPFRLPSGGRIDRDTRVGFTLDGRPMSGLAGDTLASALLANGERLVGRSFKYHRPRGFLSAGVEEPNGLFTLGEAARTEPNVPGTMTELVEGLIARCQNGMPSVRWDLRAVFGLAAPLISAGFYYKTFMGPRRGSWMLYEPFIRRAAGLGRGVHERDPDRYETRYGFTDVLVIGGGPAGLAAALAAGRAGARVLLVEQDSLSGGSLLLESAAEEAESWRWRIQSELQSLPNVEIRTRTTAFGLYDGSTIALIERRDHRRPDPKKGEARQVVTTLRARAVIFATGSTERPLVFPNNDRPGVMLASAVRSYLNRYAVACGTRAVVVTNNDSAYASAFDLARNGIRTVIADTRQRVNEDLTAHAHLQGIPHLTRAAALDVKGGRAVKGLQLSIGGSVQTLDCDLVASSGGWSPAVHLTSHGGIVPSYRQEIAAFVPGGFAPGHYGAGALMGTFSLPNAIREGFDAGRLAVQHAGYDRAASAEPPAPPAQAALAESEPGYGIEPFWPPE
jgi:NADPH-dependent 2,4-dienoyl-CoA reductase/sulfur reductase-like enzyme